ncbi:MAG: cysteine--tRNA ligase [Defluviitaleaceae bacterium]|nr:cysteine--tRNA ligase [Defluviitaleaceae bacterium]
MRIYNTLARKKEEFAPPPPYEIKMYTCGQTVYNDIHIGNARFYVVFDAVRRYLEHKGYTVRFAQNFTDVDDKIIKRANEEGADSSEIAERYIARTLEDLVSLNVRKATINPRATEEIGPIIGMIKTLVDKGFAYEKNGTVFFEAARAKDYGKLSKKNIDDLEAGARVELNEDKRNPADFVLWKPDKPGEPKWESPWGTGRPGWHIECSAMAGKYLGTTIDIHGGAEDLVFPHHENEIAQSEAANGAQFSRFWMHCGILTVGHKKMSKSKGNFVTYREAAQAFSGEVIRFYLLCGHYRTPMEYGTHLLASAQSGLARIKNSRGALIYVIENSKTDELQEAEPAAVDEAKKYAAEFEEAMDDDFNTADAIAAIFNVSRLINVSVDVNKPGASSKQFAKVLLETLDGLLRILGFDPGGQKRSEPERGESKRGEPEIGDTGRTESGRCDAEVEALINARAEARTKKDFKEADRIRDRLAAFDVVVEDTASGARWRYADR